jgi:hypothetical protein
MKKYLGIFTLILVLASATTSAQIKKEWGSKFDYNVNLEEDPKVVLADNYGHYLFSVVNKHGMMAQHGIIMRKFDQKNKLVNTFNQDFPEKTMFTLYNYLGSYELGKDKIVIFIDGYSNKTKKKSIHRMIFDKTTDKFTTTLVVDYTFESLSKSGTATVLASPNGNYFGIVYSKFSNRKIAEVNELTVIDGKTFDVVWQKTITFPIEFYSGDMTMTNSGKVVFIKRVVEKGQKHSLYVVDASGEADKDLGADIKISRPIAISIGTQDYLIAFNFKASLREASYSNIMLYDLNAGRILNNDNIDAFPGIKNIQDVKFNSVSIQNNQIALFTECKYQTGSKPSTAFPNDPKFNDPVYSFGAGMLIVMNTEGKVTKSINLLPKVPFSNGLVNNFGLLNIKGSYYMNTVAWGGDRNNEEYPVLYQLTSPNFIFNVQNIQLPIAPYQYNSSIDGEFSGGNYIHQFINYFQDSKKLLLAKYYGDGKVVFVSYVGVNF